MLLGSANVNVNARQTHKRTNAQTHKHTNAQTHKRTNARTHIVTISQSYNRQNSNLENTDKQPIIIENVSFEQVGSIAEFTEG